MIVVSNTSPITNLAAIGQLELLFRLYGEIVIPNGVRAELHPRGLDWRGAKDVSAASWIVQRAPTNTPLIEVLRRDLDRGEAEAIALAVEVEAGLALLDEREGRRIAKRLGLTVIGVLGVLLDAKQHGYITAIRPILQDLRHSAGFYLTEDLIYLVLEMAKE